MLALDLGVFHKEEKAVSFREAIAWTVVWAVLAGAFGSFIWWLRGPEEAGLFASAYLLEKALSVDNLFVILVIFTYFKIPDNLRHRVLFWGILGAAVMRAIFILAGVALVTKFSWLMYVFGAVLIFTGAKMSFPEAEGDKDLSHNPVVRLAKKIFPITHDLHGKKFFTVENGVRMATPLFLTLLVVEATDVIFAVDSIPAVIGILPPHLSQESKNFLAFTSNIFAILGLRSMFFAIAGFMKYFRFLKLGLAFILVFIGVKMIAGAAGWFHLPTSISLAILLAVLAVSVAVSVIFPEKK
jgi:tellurite resistance protein TerC